MYTSKKGFNLYVYIIPIKRTQKSLLQLFFCIKDRFFILLFKGITL